MKATAKATEKIAEPLAPAHKHTSTQPTGISAKALTVLASMDKSTVSRAVKLMLDKGYLLKHQHEHDKRAYVLSLTQQGRRLYQTLVSELEPRRQESTKKPLFIMLDGSWREAIKMFRKSPYLHDLPLLSFIPETAAKYGLRKGSRDFQLGTAEVAVLALAASGEKSNAEALSIWFEPFITASKFSRSRQSNKDLSPLKTLSDTFKLKSEFNTAG